MHTLRLGWIPVQFAAALCLVIGTENLVSAHVDAVRLSHLLHPPSTEYTGAAHGVNDPLVVLVGVVICLAIVVSAVRLATGHYERWVLGIAFFGAYFLWFDAHVVLMSGWLAGCNSCGGEPQTAQDEGLRAFWLTAAAAFLALLELAWLSLRDDYV